MSRCACGWIFDHRCFFRELVFFSASDVSRCVRLDFRASMCFPLASFLGGAEHFDSSNTLQSGEAHLEAHVWRVWRVRPTKGKLISRGRLSRGSINAAARLPTTFSRWTNRGRPSSRLFSYPPPPPPDDATYEPFVPASLRGKQSDTMPALCCRDTQSWHSERRMPPLLRFGKRRRER